MKPLLGQLEQKLYDSQKEYRTIYDYLHDFTGCSKKQKLMDDLSDFLYFEKLGWAYHNHTKFSPEVALITVSEPSTGEILDLGGSLPSDLFVDNWGIIWSQFFQQPSGSTSTASPKDTGGSSRTLNVYIASAVQMMANSSGNEGSQIQIGNSTTAVTRADVTVNTAFSTSPESAAFNTGSGSYTNGTGTITFSGSITAGNESSTINESTVLVLWKDSGSTVRTICLCHDITTATAFSNAKSITVQYSLTD